MILYMSYKDLPSSLLADTRRLVHQLLPAYCMFANRSKRSGSKPQVVTLVHYYIAARGSLFTITEQLAAMVAAPQGLAEQVHALRLIEQRTGTSLLVINTRQFQAASRPGCATGTDPIDSSSLGWRGGRSGLRG